MFYIFHDSYGNHCSQPYYHFQQDIIGNKYFYQKEDILKLESTVSKTIFSSILKLKEGKSLRLHKVSSNDYRYLRCVTQEELLSISAVIVSQVRVKEIKKEINETIPDLMKALSEHKKSLKKNERAFSKLLKKSTKNCKKDVL